MRTKPNKFQQIFFFNGQICILFCLLWLSSCSSFISSAKVDLSDDLSYAIVNNDDLATVEAGGPAYLLMIDGFLHGDPDNSSLLRSAATLYTAYTVVYIKDKDRAQRLTDKALSYGLHAVCIDRSSACSLREIKFRDFANIISTMDVKDVPTLYALGTAWAGWIQAHREDLNAVAEISRVETLMQRILELDESYQDGGAHLYLGTLATFLPAALGGKPDVGRKHFERAIEISSGKNLMAKVVYAREYARMIFDRELHDRLLHEVLKAEPNVQGYTLMNTLAQKQAQELLNSADDFF